MMRQAKGMGDAGSIFSYMKFPFPLSPVPKKDIEHLFNRLLEAPLMSDRFISNS